MHIKEDYSDATLHIGFIISGMYSTALVQGGVQKQKNKSKKTQKTKLSFDIHKEWRHAVTVPGAPPNHFRPLKV